MVQHKYFAVNEAIEDKIKSIRKDIYLSMNGICATKMSDSGLKYDQNFGVSWSRLCEISNKYTPDYELSERLWLLPIRETKLIATILCPPNELTKERMYEWLKGITTVELAEIFSFSLLRKAEHLIPCVLELEMHPEKLFRLVSYHTIARQISLYNDDQIKSAISNINVDDISDISAYRAVESLLSTVIFKSDSYNNLIKKLLCRIEVNNSLYCKELVHNIEAELI